MSIQENYFIKPNYVQRKESIYFTDIVSQPNITHQPDAYRLAAFLAERLGCATIIDIGCGRAHKLQELSSSFHIIGIDFGDNIQYCREKYSFGEWLECDFDEARQLSLDQSKLEDAFIVCCDVIEHLQMPEKLLHMLKNMLESASGGILTTPDRIRVHGIHHNGPPPNQHHIREWSLSELEKFVSSYGISINFAGYTVNNSRDREKKTSLLILGDKPRQLIAPKNFQIVSIMHVFNESDILADSLNHLIINGIDVVVVDNWSTDGSYEIAQQYLGSGVLRVERFPEVDQKQYHWSSQLKYTAGLAKELDADWFIHSEADECRYAPWEGVSLKDAIYYVDQCGFNIIDNVVLNFLPIDNGFENSSIPYYDYFTHCIFGRNSGYFKQLRMWKNLSLPVDLASSGGHVAKFSGMKPFPFLFIMKHYPMRSTSHGKRKIFQERNPRYNHEELKHGWHRHYDSIDFDYTFIWEKSSLIDYRKHYTNREFLVEILSRIGLELTPIAIQKDDDSRQFPSPDTLIDEKKSMAESDIVFDNSVDIYEHKYNIVKFELDYINSTKAWRLVQSWYRFKSKLLPSGSKRERAYFLLRSAMSILLRQGPFALTNRLIKWLRGERRYPPST